VPQTRVLLGAGSSLVPYFPGEAGRTKVRLPPDASYPRGTVLAERADRPGVFRPYRGGAADGTGVAKLLLEFDCATDGQGDVTQGSLAAGSAGVTFPTASAFFAGTFPTQELVGLDAQAASQLGSLVEGDLTAGLLRLG
jgi:hypothetical protein